MCVGGGIETTSNLVTVAGIEKCVLNSTPRRYQSPVVGNREGPGSVGSAKGRLHDRLMKDAFIREGALVFLRWEKFLVL